MTLSNFDWTDKTSVKWFILLPTGHEGPYSLEVLMKKRTSHELQIWAEGLPSPVSLKQAIQNSEDDELPPPLPPLPDEDEDLPTVSVSEVQNEFEERMVVKNHFKKRLGLVVIIVLVALFAVKEWVKTQEHFSIRRANGMSPELFQKISSDFKFESWDKKIFFKEYVPADMSHIWLVTSSFQECQVEATFYSVKGKLLAVEDEKIVFKSTSRLKNHVVEFSKFDFVSGNKIVPGLYEVDVKASDCAWDTLAAKLGNLFKAPDQVYISRMKVVLYHKGNVEFNSILDKLIQKKLALELKTQNEEELFWQDLQQKLQTLMAISLQIEQLLLELVETAPAGFSQSLKKTVDKYTRSYGHFFTEFVVSNEKYFQDLEKSELGEMQQKRKYENLIRTTSKNIGFESIKIIEELQGFKNPSKKDLEKMEIKIKKQFEMLKEALNHKIIQITEDRAN